MPCEHFLHGDTFIHRLDPRVRVVAAFAFSLIIAVSANFVAPLVGLALGTLLGIAARLPVRDTLRRFFEVNVFMLMIVVLLPFSAPGAPLFTMGPLSFSLEGLIKALLITVKGNAIVLMITVMLATMDVVRLGRALRALGTPDKLAHLFLFTVRYVDLLEHEYQRLRTAMRTRCFTPRMNMHTYRTFAYLVAMLLVRSFERSNRIMEAMKLRGFQGRFYSIRPERLTKRDAWFSATSAVALAAIVWVGVF